MNECRAFVELTSYIEKAVDSGILLFKLSEIHSMYVNRLEDLGIIKLVNKTQAEESFAGTTSQRHRNSMMGGTPY